jgi:hypothetical protein
MENKALTNSPEEIDLLSVFQSLVNIITRVVRLILQHLFLFFAILLLVSAMGYCLRYVVPQYYVTQGIFATRLLPVSYCNLLVDGLSQQAGNDEGAMAAQLGISPRAAHDIKSLSFISLPQDTAQFHRNDPEAHGFGIELAVRRMEDLDSIQNGLVNYLENNNYAVTRKQQWMEGMTTMKKTLSEKLLSLDSLKKSLQDRVASRDRGQGAVYVESADPVSVYKEEMKYYQERQEINDRLSNPNNIAVVQPFFRLTSFNRPNMGRYFKVSLAAGLLLALIVTPLYGLARERKRNNRTAP